MVLTVDLAVRHCRTRCPLCNHRRLCRASLHFTDEAPELGPTRPTVLDQLYTYDLYESSYICIDTNICIPFCPLPIDGMPACASHLNIHLWYLVGSPEFPSSKGNTNLLKQSGAVKIRQSLSKYVKVRQHPSKSVKVRQSPSTGISALFFN